MNSRQQFGEKIEGETVLFNPKSNRFHEQFFDDITACNAGVYGDLVKCNRADVDADSTIDACQTCFQEGEQ